MNIVALPVLLTCILASAACTSLQPIEASPDEVQRQLLSEQLVQPGDRVRLVTEDETVYEFRVTKIDLDQALVIGKESEVPVAEIVAVETREVSMGRTALLAGGIGTGLAIIIAFAIGPTLLLAAI